MTRARLPRLHTCPPIPTHSTSISLPGSVISMLPVQVQVHVESELSAF